MPNYDRPFDERQNVRDGWLALNGAIKANMDSRRYELATFAAAQRLRSTYCSLAHGAALERLGESQLDLAGDRATLDETDRAVMELAERVVDDATAIEDADRQRLRDLGLSDAEIADVVFAAAARCFFSKTLDALGILADADYNELAPELRAALVVGRPIAAD